MELMISLTRTFSRPNAELVSSFNLKSMRLIIIIRTIYSAKRLTFILRSKMKQPHGPTKCAQTTNLLPSLLLLLVVLLLFRPYYYICYVVYFT